MTEFINALGVVAQVPPDIVESSGSAFELMNIPIKNKPIVSLFHT